eukprot:TRINITY_DN1864_c0_g1_i3.p1 TRINITY_DN1864_c0_g1~~TRINITY_DN1864_c0_g1_i3.p1  ORF type:complete len:110 (+),score=14.95 TRINITY_DN1864_c0_g1_i3:115-444(+)
MAARRPALDLYRKILRESRGYPWKSDGDKSTVMAEVKALFHEGKQIKDPKLVADKLFEGQSRLDLALHYKIPYPRLHNVPTGATLKKSKPIFNQPFTQSQQSGGAQPFM